LQRDYAIGRRRPKDDVRRFLENLIEIESRAQRFAHLIKLVQDVRFALQCFQNFVARHSCGFSLAQDRREHVSG